MICAWPYSSGLWKTAGLDEIWWDVIGNDGAADGRGEILLSHVCHKVLALSLDGALYSDVTDRDERWCAGLYDSTRICRRVNNSHLRGTLKPRVCMRKQVISILWSSSNQMLSTHSHSKIISTCTQHSLPLSHTYIQTVLDLLTLTIPLRDYWYFLSACNSPH